MAPSQLSKYFDLLISAYQEADEGKLLVQWFREDWAMFNHPRMDESRAKDLLSEILNDGEIVRRTFSPIEVAGTDRLGDWEELRDELRYRNRFFPKVNIDLERLEDLFVHLKIKADEVPGMWYRARIQGGDDLISAEDMGPPPARIASHGRANPAGIPYLYLASTVAAAISEIRPHTGELACVADFSTRLDLTVVDLRAPKAMVSPFLLDAEDICKTRSDVPFLERLGDELTRPVIPQAAAIDYTPSQYLCEFIKKCGYDGVIYRSSVSDGINLALFNPERAECRAVAQYRIDHVLVDATILAQPS